MLPPVMAWIAAFATGTAVLVAMAPRLPVYKLTVHQMPWLQRIDNQWKTKLPTRIEFHNENFVNIYVHAISFDLYYSTDAQKGHLQHIAHVHDKNQLQSTTSGSTTTSVPPTTNDKTQPVLNNNNNNKISKRKNNNNNKPPLWSIASRSYFVTHDDMYVKLFPKSTTTSTTSHPTDEIRTSSIDWKRVLASLRILLSHWWWNGNARHVIVPATGVAHIKAAAAVVTGIGTNNNNNHHPSSTTSTTTTTTSTPTTTTTSSTSTSTSSLMAYASPALTISMVCDNLIDTWTMQVQGVDCVLHQLVPGWVPWDQAVDKMRLYALTKLTANAETGGVLASTMKTSSSGTSSNNNNDNTTPMTATPTATASSWKNLVNQLAWQDAMIAL